jgi:hypothetical protein
MAHTHALPELLFHNQNLKLEKNHRGLVTIFWRKGGAGKANFRELNSKDKAHSKGIERRRPADVSTKVGLKVVSAKPPP